MTYKSRGIRGLWSDLIMKQVMTAVIGKRSRLSSKKHVLYPIFSQIIAFVLNNVFEVASVYIACT